jgi:mRNA-degrading endonuclease RelE of RelBE toxin-antitoxin system
MSKKVQLSTKAQKELKKFPKDVKTRIRTALQNLAEIEVKRLDIKKLKGIEGREDLYRLRVRSYRITYFPEKNEIKAIRIIHRSKGYSWLE